MTISYSSLSVVILFKIICFCTSNNLAQSLLFNHLTVEDGLSNNKVNVVMQDRSGFIWFGTEDGLNRFDGYKFKIFRNSPDDSTSISDNSIWALLCDHSGNIWVGTKDGILNEYNRKTENFKRWNLKKGKGSSITALFEDKNRNIYVGTRTFGFFRLNTKTKEIFNWKPDQSNKSGLSHQSVRSICEDFSGNILIGTYDGLNKFNPAVSDNDFRKFTSQPENPNSLSSNQIYNLSNSSANPDVIWIGTPNGLTKYNSVEDSFMRIEIPNPGNIQFGSGASTVVEELINDEIILWIDTYGGLIRMNLNSGEWYRFVHEENNRTSIVSNRINKIIKDRSGVIWIATENGISYYSSKCTRFNSIFSKKQNFYLNAVKNKKDLKVITQSGNGDVWFGFSDDILTLNEQMQSVSKHPAIDNINVWSLAVDNNNELWIGTYGQGLKQFNPTTGKVNDWTLFFPSKKPAVSFVKSLLKDSKNNIWVGYWGSGVGRIDPYSGNYDLWIGGKGNPKINISNSDVWSIKEDKFGRIWLGTQGGGINLFEDKNDGIFHKWLQDADNKNILSNNNIYAISEVERAYELNNNETILWIGTANGLNKFKVKNNSDVYDLTINNKTYTVADGLPDNSVYSILEDDNGNLWLGTGSGISFFDVKRETFTNFSSADGLNGTVMNPESALDLDNGLMLFGSDKGLNIFDPKKIKLSEYKPSVVITDLQIFNEPVTVGDNSSLKQSVITTNEIILSPDQNVFSLEFAALDFNSPKSIQYAYKMEGFDREWISSGERRFVTYTNLDPGTYTFIVKATNADAVWNDQVTFLKIVVNPPWWKTFWAYALYVVLIFIGLITIRRFELNRAKMRNELRLREFEVRKKTELESFKSRFFANLSHEFRTPLMLIKGPLEQLKSGKTNDNYFENIDLIERNSNRLKALIDQLLEISQLEKAAIPLKAKQENVITIIKGLVSSFESLANQKNISLKIECDSDSVTAWIDKDKFEKIIDNLLSNAIKFTPSGGRVSVIAKKLMAKGNRFCEIKISDSGIGIPKDKIEKIFNRFFQVDDSTQRNYGGSGIGLALVKELVDLHKWNITVQSDLKKGTEFKLMIPMWDYLEEEEKLLTDSIFSDTNNFTTLKEMTSSPVSEFKEQIESSGANNKPSVLIVDDSEDVRKYLSNLLFDNYTISEADNGESGTRAATEILPDLIISDVMMPSMDGIEFCNRIKSEWQTSDIPVILLTAKASFESKIEGLEIGADDYLTKPFESKELFARIKNLLDQRKRLREKYSKDLNSISHTLLLNEADQEFINKVYELIETNINKTTFSTENLAKEMFLSRSQLHRKMISITGQAPGEFIRTIKLKQAARMLLEKKFSVTQVAYEIGFSSPAQFTRAFSKQFSCLPSEYSGVIKN